MSWARALAFNLAFFAWTAICGTVGLPFLLTPRHVTMRFGRFWAASVLALLKVIIGLDYEIRGLDRGSRRTPPLPTRRCRALPGARAAGGTRSR